MNKLKFDIIKEIGILSENIGTGMRKELNIVSWDENKPELDLREWDYNHEVFGNGITITLGEFDQLTWLYLRHHAATIKSVDPAFKSDFTVEKKIK